jgi:hypothetical protein
LLPPRATVSPDVDLVRLGEAVRFTGGQVQKAATYAAVLAADQGGEITLAHIARAVWAELNKDSRQIRPSEMGFLAQHLAGGAP